MKLSKIGTGYIDVTQVVAVVTNVGDTNYVTIKLKRGEINILGNVNEIARQIKDAAIFT